ncbi:MAG: amino acid ABC transporter permease [Proteobacteria bacterium]|nr:amino acid ABC transporter permease [Pseudomonadota bacterium]
MSSSISNVAPPVENRRRFRLLDVVILAVVAAVCAYLVWRANTVLNYNWNWARVWPFILRYDEAKESWVPNLILIGLWTTIRIAIWSAIGAAIIGAVMGLARISQSLFFRLVAGSYVELVRNMPPLVFVFVVYFFLTSQIVPLIGIDVALRNASPATIATIEMLFGPARLLPAILSAILCMALFEGAYVTEIVRAGVQSIERGQWDASKAMALTRVQTLRLVVLPQAIQRTLPPLAGQFISLVKDTSIVSLISIQDLTFLGNEVAATTTRLFETWIIIAVLYFLLCWSLSLAFARLEARMGKYR